MVMAATTGFPRGRKSGPVLSGLFLVSVSFLASAEKPRDAGGEGADGGGGMHHLVHSHIHPGQKEKVREDSVLERTFRTPKKNREEGVALPKNGTTTTPRLQRRKSWAQEAGEAFAFSALSLWSATEGATLGMEGMMTQLKKCNGDDRGSTECNQDPTHRVCAKIKGRPDFFKATNQTSWEERIKGEGYWCICKWATKDWVAAEGCDKVGPRIDCEATDVCDLKTSYQDGGKDVTQAKECVSEVCKTQWAACGGCVGLRSSALLLFLLLVTGGSIIDFFIAK